MSTATTITGASSTASHSHTPSIGGTGAVLTQLDLHEPLDIIGTGSFGIIRKVRRKADGVILARKELNFERMNERDRKQIVAEVNILKDLNHEHIVRYHDRFVDRQNGILYILMEYCGGGDLGSVIKHAQRSNRPIAEDVIWKYFLQIVLALCHCHHPGLVQGTGGSDKMGQQGHGRTSSDGERRGVVLHRDLKPENVFLDEHGAVKLGDFGLSKALAQASFANTYVGTPYYMSPEVMHEKAYDAKSDIWSLGCLIYELCALKPPFHEARSHSELSVFVKNGRIPPLGKGYSPALQGVIKGMLNLNPAMRPSAQQLLQNERLELMYKVVETERMLTAAKAHKHALLTREREIAQREAALTSAHDQLSQVQAKIAQLQSTNSVLVGQLGVAEAQNQELQNQVTHLSALAAQSAQERAQLEASVQSQIADAVARKVTEIREYMDQRETEVARANMKREEEITAYVEKSREEMNEAWRVEEVRVTSAAEERVRREVEEREERVREATRKLDEAWRVLERSGSNAGERKKTPLEEVKNILASLSALTEPLPPWTSSAISISSSSSTSTITSTTTAPRGPLSRVKSNPAIETPVQQIGRASRGRQSLATAAGAQGSAPSSTATARPPLPPSFLDDVTPLAIPRTAPLPSPSPDRYYSAMRGVVLTETGEVVATPSPAEFARMVVAQSPRVNLDFRGIFDGGVSSDSEEEGGLRDGDDDGDEDDGCDDDEGFDTEGEGEGRAGRVANLGLSELGSEGGSAGEFATQTAAAEDSESEVESDEDDTRRATTARPRPPVEESPCDRRRSSSTFVPPPPAKSAPPPSSVAFPTTTTSTVTTARPSRSRSVVADRTRVSGSTSSTVRASSVQRRTSGDETTSVSQRKKQRGGGESSHPPPTRLRRPSILNLRPVFAETQPQANPTNGTTPASVTTAVAAAVVADAGATFIASATTAGKVPFKPTRAATAPPPAYDLADEENLPSPFLRRIERDRVVRGRGGASTNTTVTTAAHPPTSAHKVKRPSAGNALRAFAAANAAKKEKRRSSEEEGTGAKEGKESGERPAIANARRASEEARKALLLAKNTVATAS